MNGSHILVVRIGSLGDIVHTLPAVATLKHSFPGSDLYWLVDRRWAAVLQDNPFVDRLILFGRRSTRTLWDAWRELRSVRFSFAVDFQGLIQSALVASLARPENLFGFHQSQVREKPAALFYSNKTRASSAHIVDRNLELAASAGATSILRKFPLPPGVPEGELPQGGYILATPSAGWRAKQWPLEFYRALARRVREKLDVSLVVNGPPEDAPVLACVPEAVPHLSGLAGLIDATRRALAVVGVDSGPLHLAAALDKPGVAVYGPTDPARNGPYGNTFTVLRSHRAVTSYRRRNEMDFSMWDISPEAVFDALQARLAAHRSSANFAV